MENNDILRRVRYALDIKNQEMVEIFNLGGVEISKADVIEMLKKVDEEEEQDTIKCNNKMLESFLNGLIVYKRGKQDNQPLPAPSTEPINNMLLKKLKIALSLTSDDMMEIFEEARIGITKSELGAILRKEGHRNYKECGDKFARNFLKGLAIKYRG